MRKSDHSGLKQQDHDLREWAEQRVYELAAVEELLQNWGKWCLRWDGGPRGGTCQSIEKRFVARHPGNPQPKEPEPVDGAAVAVEKIMRHVPREYKYAMLDYYGVYRAVAHEETRLRLTAQTLRTNVQRVEHRLEVGRNMVLNLLKREGVDLLDNKF